MMSIVCPILECKDLTKYYGKVAANHTISFDLNQGESLALIGENGSGKSTLVKILSGEIIPDSGTVKVQGTAIPFGQPKSMQDLGFYFFWQHPSLFKKLSIRENLRISIDSHHQSQLDSAIEAIWLEHGFGHYSLDSLAESLPLDVLKKIEVLKILLLQPKVLVLDEPTSMLSKLDSEWLINLLKTMQARGVSLIFITHRLTEVKALCNKALIIKKGEVSYSGDIRQLTEEDLQRYMFETSTTAIHKTLMSFKEQHLPMVNQPDCRFEYKGKMISLTKGEVLGVFGESDNGLDELFEALMRGSVDLTWTMNGEIIGDLSLTNKRLKGINFLPKDRLGESAIPNYSLTDNLLLNRLQQPKTGNYGLKPSTQSLLKTVKAIIGDFGVYPALNLEARQFSGGNLQKFLLGRESSTEPKCLVLDNPTWGIDLKSKAVVWERILTLASRGCIVIVISLDKEEIMTLSHSVITMQQGVIANSYGMMDIGRLNDETL